MYKVGDKVLLYTWEEMESKFHAEQFGIIYIEEYYYWRKYDDNYIPNDRVVTVYYVDRKGNICYRKNKNINSWVHYKIIKCNVNEYYLQQIKDEL